MNKKKGIKVPFKVEIKIMDNNGKRVFHWREGRGNLIIGLKKTNEFVEEKLGIDMTSIKKAEKKVKEITEKGFGGLKKNEPP